jgi:16S rRNA (cytosine967-C5)-methyltransferase
MNVRAAAARIVSNVLVRKESLTTVLAKHHADVADIDHALLQEMCYGCLRWYHHLQATLNDLLKAPLKQQDQDINALLLIGIYQLAFMRMPPHAAIHETVEGTRTLNKPWATGLVNGVLRNFQRQINKAPNDSSTSRKHDNSIKALINEFSHPGWLIKKIRAAWPLHWEFILNANNQRPPMTLRINQQISSRDGYLQKLHDAGIDAVPCEFSTIGITLITPCEINKLPDFATGACSVQDEAAQFAAPLLQLAPHHRVLDACAAPGGKTAHILEIEPTINVTALDHDETRLIRVTENLARLNLTAHIKCADAADLDLWWDSELFDRILLDAPCSATGVIRRHPDIKVLREFSDIDVLMDQQQKLLNGLWACLKPGGLLLYATCSILPDENTKVIAGFLKATNNATLIPIKSDWGMNTGSGTQLFPQENGHDGFFYALLSKSI